uniref:RING-type domain-containing protein n=1 Tax=Meloidogyne enterolobii TaxID=390850 RepID=A0A6V7U0Q1_MELEN|nr:unnamed protein product [Meloidogyne enterolobii]
MVYYKFGRCIICTIQLNHENAYFLNNCGHKFHHYCITRWITEEQQNCPSCRVAATLNDIKQFFVEEAGDSSDDNELTQSTSNAVNVVNNLIAKFVQSINKWRKNTFLCCSNNCINTNKPIGNCIEGNGTGNVNNENVEYMNCLEEKGGFDPFIFVVAENSFKRPQNCFNYSLFYFEIKCIFQKDEKEKCLICLNDFKTTDSMNLFAHHGDIKKKGSDAYKIENFSFNNNDFLGCGLVYPPTNKSNELPYAFFTQNGKQIGKAVLLTHNSDSYKPCIGLEHCSIEANFGNNLETKPFIYDISKHSLLKEFY